MNTIQKLENIYLENSGNNFSFLTNYNIPKTEISTIAGIYNFYKYCSDSAIDYFIHKHRKVEGNSESLKKELNDFLKFYKKTITDSKYIEFIELLAKLYIDCYRNSFIDAGFKLPKLPSNPIENSVYIDLASGLDFINFYDFLSPTSTYYLIDKSVFSCKVLELKSKECNLENIVTLNKSVEDLSKQDFNNKIGTIRAKNLFCYIQFTPELILSLQKRIAPNGIFVFQEQSQSHTMKDPVYIQVKALFKNGWTSYFKEGNFENPLDLDTLIFVKK